MEQQFLVRYIKHHQTVSLSIVFRWLKEVLEMTGINTEVFKVHSIRSASSLNAEVTGVMEYVKEHDSNFQLGILNKQL